MVKRSGRDLGKRRLFLFVALATGVLFLIAPGISAGLPASGMPGNPIEYLMNLFASLQGQVNTLSERIANITLTPGPQGPPGEKGEPGTCDPTLIESLTERINQLETRLIYLEGIHGTTVMVELAGEGSGRVYSIPEGLDCGSVCRGIFPPGTSIALVAEPAEGSVFSGWSGDCFGTAQECFLAGDSPKEAAATFSPKPPECNSAFCGISFHPLYDGTRNTSGIWSERDPAFKEVDYISTGGDVYLIVGQEPTFVLYARNTGFSIPNGEELPAIVWDNRGTVSNSTLESIFGIGCSDPAYFCTQNFGDFENISYVHNDTRFDTLSGYAFLNNRPSYGNLSEYRNQVTNFFFAGFDSVDMPLNQTFTLSPNMGLWSPMQFYRNTEQGLGQMVIPKTPTYSTDTPNYRCFTAFGLKGSQEFFFTSQSEDCLQLSDRDVSIFPLDNFDYENLYLATSVGRKNSLLDGKYSFLAESRRNERGSADNPEWTAVNYTEFVETSCNLRASYPDLEGNCIPFPTG